MSDYVEPPRIEGARIDFSEFHPLDHSLLECKGYPGGRRTHLRYRWDFQWHGDLRRRTMCRIGRHHRTQFWKYANWDKETKTRTPLPEPLTAVGCLDCGKRFTEYQPR